MAKKFDDEVKDSLKGDNQRQDLPGVQNLLREKIDQLAISMEKMKLAEYVDLLHRPFKLMYINFLAGIARGMGMAIGFTILGAIVVIILQELLVLNLPLVGGFIAELVKIVQAQLQIQPR